MPLASIDLNADLGEAYGAYHIGADEELLKWVTSASIAAGVHAGDPSVLRRTIRLAKAAGVAVGAHPGFPDRQGFGRRDMQLRPDEAEDLVLYQMAAVAGVAHAEGVSLQHVKVHGAMYNMAARDRSLADAIARAVAAFDRRLRIFALPRSAMAAAAQAMDLEVVCEAFADRQYASDGHLIPRTTEGAVIHDLAAVVDRALGLATRREVKAVDGSMVSLEADTICVHGDTPGAAEMAAAIRRGLDAHGVKVRAVSRR